MVKRLITLVNKKYIGIHEAAILLGLASFGSQVLGLVRDRALVSHIGAGQILDVYYASFRVPDLMFAFIASMVSVTALVPFLSKMKENENIGEDMQNYIFMLFKVFGFLLLISSIILFFLMPYIVQLFLVGKNNQEYFLLVTMSRIMLLSPIFLGIQNICTSVTQLYKKFFVFALAPIVYNFGILFGIYFLYPIFGPVGLAWGVVLGAFCHMLIQFPVLRNLGFNFSFNSKKINWESILDIVKVSLPRTLTLGISTITLFLITVLLIKISPGSVSLFNFALNVQSIPLMVIGLSYAVASFPLLVENFEKSKEQFFKTASTIGHAIIFWSLPCMALFIVLRAHIIRIIYGSSNFSWGDTRTTAALFALVTISVIFQSLILLFIRMYYAAGKTKFPLLMSILGFIVTISFSSLGVIYYQYIPYHEVFTTFALRFSTEATRPELLFVGMGYVLGYMTTMIGLCIGLKYHFNFNVIKEYHIILLKTLFGSIIIGFVTYGVLFILSPYFELNSFWNVFFHGSIAGLVGIAIGGVVFYLLKIETFILVLNSIKKHSFSKLKVIAPNESDL